MIFPCVGCPGWFEGAVWVRSSVGTQPGHSYWSSAESALSQRMTHFRLNSHLDFVSNIRKCIMWSFRKPSFSRSKDDARKKHFGKNLLVKKNWTPFVDAIKLISYKFTLYLITHLVPIHAVPIYTECMKKTTKYQIINSL